MANNLNIDEYTLAQISDAAVAAANTIGVAAGNRPSWETSMTIRITDHADNAGAEEDDPDLMALFTSKRHGEPWCKDYNVLVHLPILADADPISNPTDDKVSVLFPNFDYTTFE